MGENKTVRLLHLSDVHFGRPHVAAHVAAVEAFAAAHEFDVIVVSGDVSQRARRNEFRQAGAFLDRMKQLAPLLVVPGNHDTAWWFGVLNIGIPPLIHGGYRRWISKDLEPTLQIPGATIVGLNSSPGIQLHTLTKRPRDLSVRGALTDRQMDDATARFAAAPSGDFKVLVVHHNVVPGELSQRWGMTRHEFMLDAIARSGAHLVLSGHDHQEKATVVERRDGKFVASTAGTLSNRSRGGRESAFMTVTADSSTISVTPWLYVADRNEFKSATPLVASR
ncbi:MAG: metallophosphoesterase [Phycisphaerae bacterium]|nr:metallophosphoesterase [Gemmatimonadaceae bacterium]